MNGRDTPQGWEKWTPQRKRTHESRVACPLGQPEVKAVLDALGAGLWGRETAWGNAVEARRKAVKAFRETPRVVPNPEPAPEPREVFNPAWLVAGARVLAAAAEVAYCDADRRGARPKGWKPRGKVGSKPNDAIKAIRLVFGFLLRSTSPTVAFVPLNAAPEVADFEAWEHLELEALANAWRHDRKIRERWPWPSRDGKPTSVKSVVERAIRGTHANAGGLLVDADNRHGFPTVSELLTFVQEYPDPNAR